MRRARVLCAALLGATAWAVAPTSGSSAAPPEDGQPSLHLVTLEGPGTAGYDGLRSAATQVGVLELEQDRVLTALDAPEPVYRWTTALNGFAVELTPRQVARARGMAPVARVEPNAVRRLAIARTRPAVTTAAAPGDGGDGVVVGVVDTGVDPDSPVFAAGQHLGRRPASFTGPCEAGEGWTRRDCSRKIVGARHFVAGFGRDGLRSGDRVSPVDDMGHGTSIAALAAGNAAVSAIDGSQSFGQFSGAAPAARIAVYKACWAAPDPRHDGCATADLVTAIDRATADGVDVLNLSVTGAPGIDTVDLALLGAAEDDVVVAAAAGNDVPAAGYDVPWVLSVGASNGRERPGRVVVAGGPTVDGVLTAREQVGPAPLVAGGDIPAPGASPADARRCLPGSLDAARAADGVVLCERGGSGRIDKSDAVALADGVGMVLADTRRAETPMADFHAVPTVHVDRAGGRSLRRALADGPPTVRLEPGTPSGERPRVARWSARGDGAGIAVKPDLVTAGAGQLAPTQDGWQLLSGTSASSARIGGYAARLRAAHPDWSAAEVRSALTGSAMSAAGEPSSLRQGAGLARVNAALDPGLVMDVPRAAYRRALHRGRLDELNTPSVLLEPVRGTVTVLREVTNAGDEAAYFSSSRWGFRRHDVRVTPAALTIPPGASRTVRIDVSPRAGVAPGGDSGWVAWRGADGSRLRLPVVVAAD